MSNFGEALRAWRHAAGLTQAELARRIGQHQVSVANVEGGRRAPSLETISRWLEACGVQGRPIWTESGLELMTEREAEALALFRRLPETETLTVMATLRLLAGRQT